MSIHSESYDNLSLHIIRQRIGEKQVKNEAKRKRKTQEWLKIAKYGKMTLSENSGEK